MNEKLSLEGLIFQATKIGIENNVLTITLNRPEKFHSVVRELALKLQKVLDECAEKDETK